MAKDLTGPLGNVKGTYMMGGFTEDQGCSCGGAKANCKIQIGKVSLCFIRKRNRERLPGYCGTHRVPICIKELDLCKPDFTFSTPVQSLGERCTLFTGNVLLVVVDYVICHSNSLDLTLFEQNCMVAQGCNGTHVMTYKQNRPPLA